jgi:hypothetical protein
MMPLRSNNLRTESRRSKTTIIRAQKHFHLFLDSLLADDKPETN